MSTDSNSDRVRASDAEREFVGEALRNAVTEGRLSLEEGDERLAALYATKFRDELAPLTADLPRPAGADGPRTRQAGNAGGPGRGGRPPWAQHGWAQQGPGQQGSGTAGPTGVAGGWNDDGGWAQDGPGWDRLSPGGAPGGHGGHDGHRHGRWRGLRFVVIAAVLTGIWALSHGAFFWPAIPLTFMALGFFRFGMHRRHCRARQLS